jgi:hypothetical protein
MKFTSISSYFWFLLLIMANGAQHLPSLRGGGNTNSTTTSQEEKADVNAPFFDHHDLSSMEENRTLANEIIDLNLKVKDDSFVGQEELFEGDIIPDYDIIMENYGPGLAKELESEGMIEAPTGVSLQSLVTNRLWTRRVNDIVEVPYTFTNQFSSSQRAAIDNALKSLGDSAKVIKFIYKTRQSDYVASYPFRRWLLVSNRQRRREARYVHSNWKMFQ